MATLPAIGTRVSYRHWASDPWHNGTIARYWNGVSGAEYVDIARDGYRETAVLPVSKLSDPTLVMDTESQAAYMARCRRAGFWVTPRGELTP